MRDGRLMRCVMNYGGWGERRSKLGGLPWCRGEGAGAVGGGGCMIEESEWERVCVGGEEIWSKETQMMCYG